MPPLAGARLGVYEISSPLGAGGMGDVYRAHDTKLGRDIALKILPDIFVHDPERVARFRREAQVLASLNHPHIAQIYGLEEANGTQFLVLELVDGETLAHRLLRGPIPVDDALAIAKQIAEALEAAHEKNIIHRDLKPANIALTKDSAVKVLDFGLAKAVEATTSSAAFGEMNVSTITSPAMMTGVGVILGTAAYVSPEQAAGRSVDKRADIWAFGCVVFEMVTGVRTFSGDTAVETMGAVIHREPNWAALPAGVSPPLHMVLRRCLEKDPRQRLRDIGDVRLALSGAFGSPETFALVPKSPAGRGVTVGRTAMAAAAVTVVLTVVVTASMFWRLERSSQASRSFMQLSIVLPEQLSLTGGFSNPPLAVSPEGTRVVYAAGQRLYLRALNQPEATVIPGSELGGPDGFARAPFFSPDGQWIGFWQQGQLRKVSVNGGPAAAICDVSVPFGVDWGTDGNILTGTRGGILQVSASGGTPKRVVSLRGVETGQDVPIAARPQVLPGGSWILFVEYPSATAGVDEGTAVAQSRSTGERRVLLTAVRDARYVPSGHLVFGRRNALSAQPFDVRRLTLSGTPLPVLDGVATGGTTALATMWFTTAATGTLLYVPTKFGPSDVTPLTRLVLVTRSGRATTLAENAGMTWFPRFSPDGARIAYALSMGRNQNDAADVWVLDVTRGARTRVTFKGNNRFFPIWTRDGMRLTFAESSGPSNRIVWALADGSGAPEMLLEEPTRAFPNSWSPDGRTLAYHLGGNGTNATQRDIWMLHLAGGTWTKKPFVQTPFEEAGAAFSPDGHWVAYVSRKAGRNDVYARPFPGPGPEVTISVDGGQEPVWGPSGRELFYRHEGRLLVAKIAEASDRLTAGSPSPVFDDRFVPDFTGINAMANYDISPEGRRFVMVDEPAAPKAPLEAVRFQVVLNWTDELKRRVPTK